MPYYLKFVEQYPTVEELAAAPEDEVMKLWEGLGYYSRARNLHFTAKYIASELGGAFPSIYKEIRALKGVGDYTAAAIASFAYDLPHAVVDGNVYRVLSRIFGISTPIDTTAGKKEFKKLADELLDKSQPAAYNQAMMDFGATHCTPKNPSCAACPFVASCKAYSDNMVDLLPIKSKKLKRRTRYFNYLIFNYKNYIFIKKRTQKDIWKNLYEFYLIETEKALDVEALQKQEVWQEVLKNVDIEIKRHSKPYKQQLTHQKIIATFTEIEIKNVSQIELSDFLKISKNQLKNYAFPRLFNWYFEDKLLYLTLF